MCYVFIWWMGSPSVARPWEDNHQKPRPSQGPLWKIRLMGVKGKRSGLWAPLPLCWSGQIWESSGLHDRLHSNLNSQNIIIAVGYWKEGAPYVQGTLERGGMRLYLVSHLAVGWGGLETSHTGPKLKATRCPCRKKGLQRFPVLSTLFSTESICSMWFY